MVPTEESKREEMSFDARFEVAETELVQPLAQDGDLGDEASMDELEEVPGDDVEEGAGHGSRFTDEPGFFEENRKQEQTPLAPTKSYPEKQHLSQKQVPVNPKQQYRDPLQQQPPQNVAHQKPQSQQQLSAGVRRAPRQKNKDFQDVEKTGRWGSVSRKEIIIVIIVVLLVLGGVGAAIGIFVSRGSGPAAAAPQSESPSAAPSSIPVVDASLQLSVILNAVKNNQYLNSSAPLLPENHLFYEGISDLSTVPASVRAVSWLIYEDAREPGPDDPWLLLRYVLATMFFSLRGEGWSNKENWLTAAHACNWHGIICDRFNKFLREVDLSANNLAGTIPPEINMLTDLRSLVMQDNDVGGTIPALELGSIPDLSILFLNNNKLSGDLEELEPLRANGVLSTLLIQENNITGRWPRSFCPRSGCPPLFLEFSLDCTDETRCLCCEANNCF